MKKVEQKQIKINTYEMFEDALRERIQSSIQDQIQQPTF
jgi:hypothetical protein